MRTLVAATVATLAVALITTVRPTAVHAVGLSFSVVADASVSSDEPDRNFGSADHLLAGTVAGGGVRRAYLRFDVGPLGGKLAGARLQLRADTSGDVTVSTSSSSWSEDGITWSNAPVVRDAIGGDSRLGSGTGLVDFKIDPDAVPDDGAITLVLTSSDGLESFESREGGDGATLEVQLTSADGGAVSPTATPSGGSAGPSPTASDAATPSPTGTRQTPPIPAGYGQLLRKDFSDGRLAPFRILTYPNDHPGDLMVQYGRFVSDSAHVSVHDGYLDLRATRTASGWDEAFVGTGLTGDGSAATFTFQYGTARAMARMNSGAGAWQSLWYLVGDSWGSPEIDWAELIDGRLTANLHGSSSDGQKTSQPLFPSDEWHEYGITKTPTYIAFLLDGREVARTYVSMTSRMALLADAKVGLSAPTSSTPSTLFLQVAWWTVDPLS